MSAPKPTPTATPLFASEEDALDAARATYEGFLRTAETIMDEGGVHPERIDEFASPSVAEREKVGFVNIATANERVIGSMVLKAVALQAYRPEAVDGAGIVSIYACVNVADTDVVDEDGNSVVSAERSDENAFEVGFDADVNSPTKLRMSSKLLWEAGGVC